MIFYYVYLLSHKSSTYLLLICELHSYDFYSFKEVALHFRYFMNLFLVSLLAFSCTFHFRNILMHQFDHCNFKLTITHVHNCILWPATFFLWQLKNLNYCIKTAIKHTIWTTSVDVGAELGAIRTKSRRLKYLLINGFLVPTCQQT